MQHTNDQPVQDEGGVRVLSLGSMRIHNLHLQSGRSTDRVLCRICSEGLEGALARTPDRPVEKPEVVESDGADAEGDATPPLGGGYDL